MGSLYLIGVITLFATISCNVLAAPETCSDSSSLVYKNSKNLRAIIKKVLSRDLKGFAMKSKVSSNDIKTPMSAVMETLIEASASGSSIEKLTLKALSLGHLNTTITQEGIKCVIDSLDVLGQRVFSSAIFVDKPLVLKGVYEEKMQDVYRSEIEDVNFEDTSAVARTINNWFREKTTTDTWEFIRPDELGHDTSLVFATASHMKVLWKWNFNSAYTHNAHFYRYGARPEIVEMMYNVNTYRYGFLPEAQAMFIEIPLKTCHSGDVSMYIIRPLYVNKIPTWRNNLGKVTIDMLLERGEYKYVGISLPKFRIEKTEQLKPRSSSNSSGIVDRRLSEDVEKVKFFNKIFLEVNDDSDDDSNLVTCHGPLEKYPQPNNADSSVRFEVDRAFAFVIATKEGLTLFDGLVLDPSKDFHHLIRD